MLPKLAYKLTMQEENVFRGTVSKVLTEIERQKLKGEFVLIIDNKIKHSKRI